MENDQRLSSNNVINYSIDDDDDSESVSYKKQKQTQQIERNERRHPVSSRLDESQRNANISQPDIKIIGAT
jgi:hypothetical protein